MKEVEGLAIWQVLTFQGNNEEEIVSGIRPDAEPAREGIGVWKEREEGRHKEITLK